MMRKADGYTPEISSPEPEGKEKKRPIDSFVTAEGSVYTYLEDGRTQRHKKATGKLYEPQDAIVFIPDLTTYKGMAPKDLDVDAFFGDSDAEYCQRMLDAFHHPNSKIYIVTRQDGKTTVLETNAAIAQADSPIYLAFANKDGSINFALPVSAEPQMGFYTYDTRKYRDEKTGKTVRTGHIGNPIVEIRYKE